MKMQGVLFIFAAVFGAVVVETRFPWYVKVGLVFFGSLVCVAFNGIFEYLDKLEMKL